MKVIGGLVFQLPFPHQKDLLSSKTTKRETNFKNYKIKAQKLLMKQDLLIFDLWSKVVKPVKPCNAWLEENFSQTVS
mgnify:CR=1 FL=1